MIPVAEDNREIPFECSTINPRLSGRSTHGITDDTDGYPQAVGQHTAEVIGDGREAFDRRFVGFLPRPYLQQLQLIDRIERCFGPLHRVGGVT